MTRTRFFIVLLAVVVLAHGTARTQVDVDFGFLAGGNLSTLTGDTGQIFTGSEFDGFETLTADLGTAKMGMTMGGFMVVSFDRDVSLRLEAIFTELGAKGTFTGVIDIDGLGLNDIEGDVSIKTTYVEFPLLVAFPLPVADRSPLHGLLGMSICIATDSEMRFDSVISGYLYSDPLALNHRVRSLNYHGIAGIEYTAYLNETPFLLGLRHEFGLRPFDENLGGDPDQEYKHRSWVATLGILF